MEIIQVVQPALNNASVVKVRQDSGYSGKSAYDIWLEQGNTGTEADFLDSLKGQDGLAGEAATITVGIVQTVPYTNSVTVTNSGDQYNAVLNFGIPRGESGKTIVSPTPPANPYEGLQWFNSSTGNTYIYYDGFWVQDANALVSGASGPNLYTVNGTLTSNRTVTMANFGLTFTGGTVRVDKIAIGYVGDTVLSVQGDSQLWGTANFQSTKGNQISHIHYGTNGDIYLRSASTAGVIALQTAGGNVLIGTMTDAGYKVNVNGDGRFVSNLTAASFIKSGGTSSQFLKADGSVDTNLYTTTARTITINGVSYDLSADRAWTITAGIGSFNGLTTSTQTFATGTTGTDFNISSAGSVHTFNIPDASQFSRGLVSTGTQVITGFKTFDSTFGVRSQGLIIENRLGSLNGTGATTIYTDLVGDFYISKAGANWSKLSFTNTVGRTYTLRDMDGTVAFLSDLSSLSSYVPATRTITINGVTYDLSSDRTWTVSGGGGGSLSTLTDVSLASSLAGQVLTYNGTNWINQDLPTSVSANLFNYYNFS